MGLIDNIVYAQYRRYPGLLMTVIYFRIFIVCTAALVGIIIFLEWLVESCMSLEWLPALVI